MGKLYRVLCGLSLLVLIYLTIELKLSGTLEYKLIAAFGLFIVVVILGIMDWRSHDIIVKRQEEELKMYRLYIRPLEELVKRIRIKQHEFDNHTNAILNMHLTIDNYDELVEAQSAYITSAVNSSERKYLPLLKISDKVLAGFIYSKLVNAPKNVETELYVRNLEIISQISESHLIEIIGTLVDNAYEACDKKYRNVIIDMDSSDDRLIFEIQNQYPILKFGELEKFFEPGYSTKASDGSRGYGLYQARKLVGQFGGELTVGSVKREGENYISFKVVL